MITVLKPLTLVPSSGRTACDGTHGGDDWIFPSRVIESDHNRDGNGDSERASSYSEKRGRLHSWSFHYFPDRA